MIKNKIFTSILLLSISASVFAQGATLRPTSCPMPQNAFEHAGPGSLWTLSNEYKEAGWFIMQTPQAINSKTTHFKDNVTFGLTVYFSDSKYGSPLQATCKYSIDADEIYLSSIYSYDPSALSQSANKYPDHYKAPDRFHTVCQLGITTQNGPSKDDHACDWSAIVG